MDTPDSESTTLTADTHQQHDFPLKQDRPGSEKGRREPVEHEMFESEPEEGHTFRTKPELESGQEEKNSLGAPHPSSEPHIEAEEDYLFGKQLESNKPPKGDNSPPESLSEVKSESHETHSQIHNDKGENHLFQTKSVSKESPTENNGPPKSLSEMKALEMKSASTQSEECQRSTVSSKVTACKTTSIGPQQDEEVQRNDGSEYSTSKPTGTKLSREPPLPAVPGEFDSETNTVLGDKRYPTENVCEIPLTEEAEGPSHTIIPDGYEETLNDTFPETSGSYPETQVYGRNIHNAQPAIVTNLPTQDAPCPPSACKPVNSDDINTVCYMGSPQGPETLVPEGNTRDACQNTDSENNFDSDQGETSAEEEDYVLEDTAHPSVVPHERHSFRYNEGFDTGGASAKVGARTVPRSRPNFFRTRSETSMGTTKRTTPNNSNRSISYLDDDSESEASPSSGYRRKKSASFGASRRRSRSRSSSRINTHSMKRRTPRKRSSLYLLNSDSSSSEDENNENQAENGMCTIEENRQCHRFPNRFKRRKALKAVVSRVPKDNQDDKEQSSLVTADRHRKEERHTSPEDCEEANSLASRSAQEHASSTHSSEICSNLGQACAGETGGHESRKQKMKVDKSQKLSSRQSKPESVKELGSVAEGQASGWPNGDIENDTENKSEDLAMNENVAETAAVKQDYPNDPSLSKPSANHPEALSQTDASGLEPAQTNTAGCNANAGSGESTQDVPFSLFETPRRSQTPVPHPLPISRLDDDDTGDELQQQDPPPPQTSPEESAASAVPDAAVSNERPNTQQSPGFNQQGNSALQQIADTVHLTPGFNQQGNSTSLQIADTVRLRPRRIRGLRGPDFLMPRILGASAPDVCTTATVVDLKGRCVDMRCLQDRHRVGRKREIRWVERLHYIDDHQVSEDGSDIEQLRRLFRSRHTEHELGFCLLCSIHRADCVLLNCQHCVVCVYCASGLAGCPLCGAEVLSFIRIY
ncbi:uncharacterized protein [Littorina saxatilis]|uniref:uncharacterized protein n=1 Tax=Littorina saxatilis TaxID=31220 RepID=UPI0038B519D2